jgi:CheY-like chemotaxis protein
MGSRDKEGSDLASAIPAMPQRVLWVEDEVATIDGTRQLLELEGHTVVVESAFDGAARQLENGHFDLLVVDQRLHGEDAGPRGTELISSLKAGSLGTTNTDVPFAFVTAYAHEVAPVAPDLRGFLGVFEKSTDFTLNLLEILRGNVAVPCLIGPDGRPISRGTPTYRQLATELRAITDEALHQLGEHPHWMLELHWRDFEELIAELFVRNGFEVTPTAPSGDRGVDLYAVRHSSLGSSLYVVECKRFRQDRPVGPSLVRQLRGVVDRENATCGVLATTSYFTQKAEEERDLLPFRLSLRDLKQISAWVAGEPLT